MAERGSAPPILMAESYFVGCESPRNRWRFGRWITPHCNGPAGRNGPCDSHAARRPAGRLCWSVMPPPGAKPPAAHIAWAKYLREKVPGDTVHVTRHYDDGERNAIAIFTSENADGVVAA